MIYSMEELPGLAVEEEHGINSVGSENDWTVFQDTYPTTEVVWGFVLLFGIFSVNGFVLWVVAKSRELWKPRHLWMACLCLTDLFVGFHKCLELLLLLLPQREICVLMRSTMGLPYILNMAILTLLSLDRFIAVRYPFYYSATVTNKHVFIGFLLVLLAGSSLAGVSVTLGLQDPVCRAQSIQLVYLTIVLTICSILILVFNSSVLRIAKKQLNAIYAHEPVVNARRVSLFCTNCGHKNATYVNTIAPPRASVSMHNNGVGGGGLLRTAGDHSVLPITCTEPRELREPLVLSPQDLDAQYHHHRHHLSDPDATSILLESAPLTMNDASHCGGESGSPMIRTISLPTLPETVTLVVPPDPIIPTTALLLANSASEIMENTCKMNGSLNHLSPGVPPFPGTVKVALPRSHSFTCAKKSPTAHHHQHRHHLFRSLHFSRSHMFHVGRLLPSMRFSRTIFLIMVPMHVFIVPIITIIPLHRGCVESHSSDVNCEIVNKLWAYLLIHMRSVLPLQAILDTLIYALGSKEFRHAVRKMYR